jgi:heme-degrading monooxygenase HmoA
MVDTPWRSLSTPDRGREYLALLSYLPLKGFRKLLTLQRQSSKVGRQLAETHGLVGYSFRAKLSSHRFWTLSIWEDEQALMAFVGRDPHRATMGLLQPYMGESAFTRWTIRGSDVPPSWDDAIRQSDVAATK